MKWDQTRPGISLLATTVRVAAVLVVVGQAAKAAAFVYMVTERTSFGDTGSNFLTSQTPDHLTLGMRVDL